MEKVAHIKNTYLRISETFIYKQITNLKNFKPIVLTNIVKNLSLFPISPLYTNSVFGAAGCFIFKKLNFFETLPTFFYKYFEEIIKREDVSILHAHFGPEGVYSIPLKEKCKIPLITSFYSYDCSDWLLKIPLWTKRYKKLFKEADVFLPLSNFLKNKLIEIGCPEEKITVHRLGIDLSLFPFKKREFPKNRKVKLLFVARLVEAKGVIYLIQAMSKIIKKYPNVSLKIIGGGPEYTKAITLAKKLNLSTYITFSGAQPYHTVIKEIQNSHIVVQPSITDSKGETEGQCAVLLEAEASGAPVVSTWHNGIPEGVLHEKTGLLVKEKDANDLARNILYLLNNPDLWVKYGKSGRKYIEKKFNIVEQTKKLEKIYDEALNR
jgi:glycosyltransferase involved in cell wall biosynthesis